MGKGNGKRPTQRQLRVAEEIRHSLSTIIQRGELNDPELEDLPVTVSEVRVSSDLRIATAFILPLGGKDTKAVVEAMSRAEPFFRQRIGKSVVLKYVPEIRFRADQSFEYAERIGKVLRLATRQPGAQNKIR